MKVDERARHRKIEALLSMLQSMKHDMLSERLDKTRRANGKLYDEKVEKTWGKKITITIPEGYPHRGSLLDAVDKEISRRYKLPKPINADAEYSRLRRAMDRYLEQLHVKLLWDDKTEADQILKEFKEFFEKL